VPWNTQEVYDRLGLEDQYIEILGVKVPMYTIPITPGRNLAVILEVAAMNNRQRKMGYNTAEEFNQRMMEQIFAPKEDD
jgi:HPr kinase/phosphorylase